MSSGKWQPFRLGLTRIYTGAICRKVIHIYKDYGIGASGLCRGLRWGISITLTSQWARWRLKSPASRLFTQLFIQVQIKKKHQSSASLAFMWRIHRGPVNSPHKRPVTRKMFHLMTSSWEAIWLLISLNYQIYIIDKHRRTHEYCYPNEKSSLDLKYNGNSNTKSTALYIGRWFLQYDTGIKLNGRGCDETEYHPFVIFCVCHNVLQLLTHWGLVTYICVIELGHYRNDKSSFLAQREYITWANADL